MSVGAQLARLFSGKRSLSAMGCGRPCGKDNQTCMYMLTAVHAIRRPVHTAYYEGRTATHSHLMTRTVFKTI
jgi:hypothetical protein